MIANYFEKNDFMKLQQYITRYYELKQELENGNESEYLKNVVTGFEETYNQCDKLLKQIIQMSWLSDRQTDEVICKVLNITNRKLNKIRTNILISFAENMGYV